ncbi:polysaccharide deacetylase family protein [Clostridium polynesiense]|uniref:polysaccharide deacetylase family protein n=1 Tax=Clostridium polynesiense TaxID=1325933 RepID=UPI000693E9F6|nr:polysaccharide deacetylase family protein [Clostridium polynesiense]
MKKKGKIITAVAAALILSGAVIFYSSTKDSYSLPIFMYHYITDTESDEPMHVSKAQFREQIKYLKENNYKFLTLDELYEIKSKGKKFPRKAIVITFDDGYENIYTNAYPVMKEFDAKGSVYVITNKIGVKGYLNKRQIKELKEAGYIDIGSHTVNHPRLDELSYENQLWELKESKKNLEEIVEKKVDCLVYPYGGRNKDTIKAAEAAGYKLAFVIDSDYTKTYSDNYELKRLVGLSDLKRLKKLSKISRTNDFKKHFRKLKKYVKKL